MDDEDITECPVCGVFLPVSEIQQHAELHFLIEDEQANGFAGCQTDSGIASYQEGKVRCPYGCGAFVHVAELDSHEEAHR